MKMFYDKLTQSITNQDQKEFQEAGMIFLNVGFMVKLAPSFNYLEAVFTGPVTSEQREAYPEYLSNIYKVLVS